MSRPVVELHVPLVPAPDLPEGAYQFPWIEDIEEHLTEQDTVEELDDGEEVGDFYVFFITGAEESVLLEVAATTAALESVPSGTFAIVTDDESDEIGEGRRVELPRA